MPHNSVCELDEQKRFVHCHCVCVCVSQIGNDKNRRNRFLCLDVAHSDVVRNRGMCDRFAALLSGVGQIVDHDSADTEC